MVGCEILKSSRISFIYLFKKTEHDIPIHKVILYNQEIKYHCENGGKQQHGILLAVLHWLCILRVWGMLLHLYSQYKVLFILHEPINSLYPILLGWFFLSEIFFSTYFGSKTLPSSKIYSSIIATTTLSLIQTLLHTVNFCYM